MIVNLESITEGIINIRVNEAISIISPSELIKTIAGNESSETFGKDGKNGEDKKLLDCSKIKKNNLESKYFI